MELFIVRLGVPSTRFLFFVKVSKTITLEKLEAGDVIVAGVMMALEVVTVVNIILYRFISSIFDVNTLS